MPLFTRLARPARPAPVRRTRLGLEALADRAAPSTLTGDPGWDYTPPPPQDPGTTPPMYPPAPPAAAGTPQILDFKAVQVSPGWFLVSGRVDAGEASGGQVVTFGGVPPLVGEFTTTLSDGSFSVLIPVAADGSEDGTGFAVTIVNGVSSDFVYCDVSTGR